MPALIAALQDKVPRVRSAAVSALARIGSNDPASAETIQKIVPALTGL